MAPTMTYPSYHFTGINKNNSNTSSSTPTLPPLSGPLRGPPPNRPLSRPPSLYHPPPVSHPRSSSSTSDVSMSSVSNRGWRTSGSSFGSDWSLLSSPESPPPPSASPLHLSFISSDPRVFVDTLKGFLSNQSSSSPSSSHHARSGSSSSSSEYNPYSNLPPPPVKTLTIWPSAVRDALSAPLRPPSMTLPSRPPPATTGRLTPSLISYSRSSSPFDQTRPRSNSALGLVQELTVPSTFPTPKIGNPRKQCNKLKRRGRSGSRSGSGSSSDFDELLLDNKDWAKLRIKTDVGGGDRREQSSNEKRSREYEEELFGSSASSSSGSPPSLSSSFSSSSSPSSFNMSFSTSSLVPPQPPSSSSRFLPTILSPRLTSFMSSPSLLLPTPFPLGAQRSSTLPPSPYFPKTPSSSSTSTPLFPRTPTTPKPPPPPPPPPAPLPSSSPPHLPLFLSALHALRLQGTVEELNLAWYVDQGSESKWSMGPFPMREIWTCVGVGVSADDDDEVEDNNRRRRRRLRGLRKLTIDAQIPKVAEMLWVAVQLGEEGEREQRARARARSSAAEVGFKRGGDQGNVKSSKYDDNRPPLIPSLEELHLTLRTDPSSASSNGNGPLTPLLALIITLVNRLGGAIPTFITPISVLRGKGVGSSIVNFGTNYNSGNNDGLRVLTIRTIGHIDLGFLGLLGTFPRLRKLELCVPLDVKHLGATSGMSLDKNDNNNGGEGQRGAEAVKRLIGNHRELRELSLRYSRCCWDPPRDGFCVDGHTHAILSGLALPCLQSLEVGLHLVPCPIMLRALSRLQPQAQLPLSALSTLILKDRSLTLEETRVVLRPFAGSSSGSNGGGLRRLSMYAKKLSPQLVDVVAWSCPMLSVWEVDVQMAVKSEDGEEVDDVPGFCDALQKHAIDLTDDEWRYRTWTLSDVSVLKWEFQVGHGYSVGCMTAIAKVVPSVRSFAGRAAVWASWSSGSRES